MSESIEQAIARANAILRDRPEIVQVVVLSDASVLPAKEYAMSHEGSMAFAPGALSRAPGIAVDSRVTLRDGSVAATVTRPA